MAQAGASPDGPTADAGVKLGGQRVRGRRLAIASVVMIVAGIELWATWHPPASPPRTSAGGGTGSWLATSARSEAARFGDTRPLRADWAVADGPTQARLFGVTGHGSRLGPPDYLVVVWGRFRAGAGRTGPVLLYVVDPRLHTIEEVRLASRLPDLRGAPRLRPLSVGTAG